MFTQVELNGAVAPITGASWGLGKSIAIEFGRAGARLVIVGRDAEALAQTESEARAAGAPDVQVHQADLTRQDAASAAVEAPRASEVTSQGRWADSTVPSVVNWRAVFRNARRR